MNRGWGFALATTLLPVMLVALPGCYPSHYGRRPVTAYEVNAPTLERHLLIATEGSAYKDAVVKGVVGRLRERPIHIRVVDVAELTTIDENEWSAIVVMYHWEKWKPQPDAARFLQASRRPERIIPLCTSGGGDRKLEGMDTITSASRLESVPTDVEKILARLEPLLR